MMKISNSKKELAKIISRNGGWREGANWVAMDGLRNGTYNVAAYGEIPVYEKVNKWHKPSDFTAYYEDWFYVSTAIKNFHQTTLSRAEYFHLYPVPDDDGWIEWKGGERPVEVGALIDVKYRDLHVQLGSKVGDRSAVEMYATTYWGNSGGAADIIAYRLHKPEQADPEFCESVMLSIPEPEVKPTIEQLAADYRNKLDYADRKQDEADKAKVESDSALSELEKAIAAIGFAITPIGAVAQEPELVITCRSQLELEDVIWLSECRPKNDMPEGEYRVVKVGTIGVEFNGRVTYPDFSVRSWRFIRRPAK
ncbi:MAG: hypothetical protein ACRC0J_16960 [Shewanella oncorhynchi]